MYDIVAVGSAVLDVLCKSSAFRLMQSKEFAGGVAICEAYEGKMEADEIGIASGGGATNNAVSFARKKLRTAIIAELGMDLTGRMVSAELTREGVDTKYLVMEEGEETGISIILISGDGGRSIVTYRGASRRLTSRDIPWEELRTKWLHISSLGGRMALLEELLSWAKKHKVRLAINPGKDELRQRERLWKCIRSVDVLLVNREEAALLTGDNYNDPEIYKSEACLVGPKISIITAGEMGGKVCENGKCFFYAGSKLNKVSSVGAGDAFGSGFVAGIFYGKSVKEAVSWGRRNAESVLATLSAKNGLLRLSELEASDSR